MSKPLDPPGGPRYPKGSGDRQRPDNVPLSEQRSPGVVISSPPRPVPGQSQREHTSDARQAFPPMWETPRMAAKRHAAALKRRLLWSLHSRHSEIVPEDQNADLAAWRRLGA